jgi:hypothetical protein
MACRAWAGNPGSVPPFDLAQGHEPLGFAGDPSIFAARGPELVEGRQSNGDREGATANFLIRLDSDG